MANVADAIRQEAPRLGRLAEARGARLELLLDAEGDVEEHIVGPLVTLLFSAARFVTGPVLRVRARDRTGGDVEVVVDGVGFPEPFPTTSPDADLWALASAFLREHHRARIGRSGERLLLLLPARERAADLRAASKKGPT